MSRVIKSRGMRDAGARAGLDSRFGTVEKQTAGRLELLFASHAGKRLVR